VNTWTVSWPGLRTVVELEIKQRIRSKRWIWALAVWFLLIGAITVSILGSAAWLAERARPSDFTAGPLAFGTITFFVLGMGLLIAPAFTSTSINGDRAAGTLATLQATRLSAVEIALGKLIAAWLAAAVFLVVALPFIALSMVLGNISVWQVMVTFAVVFTLVAVVCAIGLGWSALMSRGAISTLFTYLSVVVLTVLTPISLALTLPLVIQTDTIRVWGASTQLVDEYDNQLARYWDQNPNGQNPPMPPVDRCTWHAETQSTAHADRTWWIVAVNPFVVVADAAPLPPGAAKDLTMYSQINTDPLAMLKMGVRSMSQPNALERDECASLFISLPNYNVSFDEAGNVTATDAETGRQVSYDSPVKRKVVNAEAPIWPWGLGANLLLGGGMFFVAVRRLRVPYQKLAPGTRVA
jgi:ABC-2 type transport system permease protein